MYATSASSITASARSSVASADCPRSARRCGAIERDARGDDVAQRGRRAPQQEEHARRPPTPIAAPPAGTAHASSGSPGGERPLGRSHEELASRLGRERLDAAIQRATISRRASGFVGRGEGARVGAVGRFERRVVRRLAGE